jgi:hypothetical protein
MLVYHIAYQEQIHNAPDPRNGHTYYSYGQNEHCRTRRLLAQIETMHTKHPQKQAEQHRNAHRAFMHLKTNIL